MKKRILEIIPVIIALVLSVGVVTVFKACGQKPDGSWMHCHAAQNDAFILGLVAAAVGAAGFFTKNHTVKTVIGILEIILGIVTVLIPGVLVHLCMMETMRCVTVTKPFIVVAGIVFIVSEIVNVAVLIGSKGVKNEENLQEASN